MSPDPTVPPREPIQYPDMEYASWGHTKFVKVESHGVGTIELVLIVLALAVLAFLAWYLLKRKNRLG